MHGDSVHTQGADNNSFDTMEFGRRMTIEREIDSNPEQAVSSVVFDESSNFILYPTLLGIKGSYLSTLSIHLLNSC